MKTCKDCGIEKATDDFYKNRGHPQPCCKKCAARRTIEWRERNPERALEIRRKASKKQKAKISARNQAARLARSPTVCALPGCDVEFPPRRNAGRPRLYCSRPHVYKAYRLRKANRLDREVTQWNGSSASSQFSA